MNKHDKMNNEQYGGIGLIIDRKRRDGKHNNCTLALDTRLLSKKTVNYIINSMECYTLHSESGDIYRLIFMVDAAKLLQFYFMKLNEIKPENPDCYICGMTDVLFEEATQSIDYRFSFINAYELEERTAKLNLILNLYMKMGIQPTKEYEQTATTDVLSNRDLQIIHNACAKNGNAFTRLFYEGIPKESDDGAGLSLTNYIAYFCHWEKDAADIIKRIFKQSQLYHNYIELWERGNHLDNTIKTSLATYNKPRTES